jgi:hypothetical protein
MVILDYRLFKCGKRILWLIKHGPIIFNEPKDWRVVFKLNIIKSGIKAEVRLCCYQNEFAMGIKVAYRLLGI